MLTNSPKLRFPEFDEPWTRMQLDDFLTQEKRAVPKPESNYLALGVRSHFKGIFQKPNSNPEKIAMKELYKVCENDLVVNITFAWEGAIAIARNEDHGGLVSHRFPTYVFDVNITHADFYRYVYPTRRMKYTLESISPGGAGRNRVLRKKDFLEITVSLPIILEQKKISSFLSTVDSWIQNLQKQKAALEKYKKGMMQKIFSQQIRFKDDDGSEFPEWRKKSLGDIAIFMKGKGISKSDVHAYGINQCIRYGELYTSYKEVINEVVSRTNLDDRESVTGRKNDLLIPSSGETAIDMATASALGKSDVLIGGDINIVRFKEKSSGQFFAYYLTNFLKNQLARFAQGISVMHLYNSSLKKLEVDAPSVEEQDKIASFLSSIDKLIESKESEISIAREWKKGLLQQMFV